MSTSEQKNEAEKALEQLKNEFQNEFQENTLIMNKEKYYEGSIYDKFLTESCGATGPSKIAGLFLLYEFNDGSKLQAQLSGNVEFKVIPV